MPLRWWKNNADSQCSRQEADTESDLEAAQRSLETARRARVEQERKRVQERSLVQRLDRLAGEDSNHLGKMVLEALTERFERGNHA